MKYVKNGSDYMKEKVNIENWERKEAFNFFSKFNDPYASVTTIINVDKLLNYAKDNKLSFYGIMSYVVLKTINDLNEYKYVLEDDGVYKYNQINMSFSVLKNNNILNFSRTVLYNDFEIFIKDFIDAKNEAESESQIPYISGNNKIYITCIPWIRITAVDNPKNYDKVDSIPRICWGKYFFENGEYKMDISLQINHAFQDGYHIGLFFNTLQDNISKFMEKDNEKKYCLHRFR